MIDIDAIAGQAGPPNNRGAGWSQQQLQRAVRLGVIAGMREAAGIVDCECSQTFSNLSREKLHKAADAIESAASDYESEATR